MRTNLTRVISYVKIRWDYLSYKSVSDLRDLAITINRRFYINEQRGHEYKLSLTICFLMVIAALGFRYAPNLAVFNSVYEDWHIYISPDFFAILCAVGAVAAMVALFSGYRLTKIWKCTLTQGSAIPVVLYILPVGWYIWRTRGGGLGVGIYVCFALIIIFWSQAVYRRHTSESTETTTTISTTTMRTIT